MTIFKSSIFALSLLLASFTMAESHINVEEMLIQAEQANAQAAEIGFEWRDTGKFIAEAKVALADGKKELAFQLAAKAYEQATLAIKQGEYQRENWEKFIPM